jgi:dynactin complex subunit
MDDFLKNLSDGLALLNKNQNEAFRKIDHNFESISLRISNLERTLGRLSKDSEHSFSSVGKKIDELKHEVYKIQKVSNYSQEYENLMKIVK